MAGDVGGNHNNKALLCLFPFGQYLPRPQRQKAHQRRLRDDRRRPEPLALGVQRRARARQQPQPPAHEARGDRRLFFERQCFARRGAADRGVEGGREREGLTSDDGSRPGGSEPHQMPGAPLLKATHDPSCLPTAPSSPSSLPPSLARPAHRVADLEARAARVRQRAQEALVGVLAPQHPRRHLEEVGVDTARLGGLDRAPLLVDLLGGLGGRAESVR